MKSPRLLCISYEFNNDFFSFLGEKESINISDISNNSSSLISRKVYGFGLESQKLEDGREVEKFCDLVYADDLISSLTKKELLEIKSMLLKGSLKSINASYLNEIASGKYVNFEVVPWRQDQLESEDYFANYDSLMPFFILISTPELDFNAADFKSEKIRGIIEEELKNGISCLNKIFLNLAQKTELSDILFEKEKEIGNFRFLKNYDNFLKSLTAVQCEYEKIEIKEVAVNKSNTPVKKIKL